jgi:hypothetical protein
MESNAPTQRLSHVFLAIADLAIALGEAPINKCDGCWEHAIDENWWVAVNPHLEPRSTSSGEEVPSGHAYVKFNGWPAGLLTPFGGTLAAGAAANEDTLIAALQAKTLAVKDSG